MKLNSNGSESTLERHLQYGEYRILYSIVFSQNQTRSIKIKIHPDCRVTVHVPPRSTELEIDKALKKRTRWIFKYWNEFKEQANPVLPRRYCSGESHFYLGRNYLLKVFVDKTKKEQIKLYRGKFELIVSEKKPDKVKAKLNKWYTEKAKYLFDKRLQLMLEKTLWVKDKPQIRLQTMRTQWGSCSPNGQLTLNPHLIKAPRECIDYVILHELCHIAEHNHSEKFYRLMNKVMPRWEDVKKMLDSRAAIFLNGIN